MVRFFRFFRFFRFLENVVGRSQNTLFRKLKRFIPLAPLKPQNPLRNSHLYKPGQNCPKWAQNETIQNDPNWFKNIFQHVFKFFLSHLVSFWILLTAIEEFWFLRNHSKSKIFKSLKNMFLHVFKCFGVILDRFGRYRNSRIRTPNFVKVNIPWKFDGKTHTFREIAISIFWKSARISINTETQSVKQWVSYPIDFTHFTTIFAQEHLSP